MLALYTLSSCVYRSSRFDKYRLDKQTDGQSWFLVWELPELYYKQIRILQVTSLWNFVPNCGLRKFRHGKSITELVDSRTYEMHFTTVERVVAGCTKFIARRSTVTL